MKYTEIKVPQMGEGVTEATVTRWLVKEGEKVSEDQVIVELATDKVDNELPSPVSGVIAKILIGENQVVQVGKSIAIVTEDGKLPDKTPPSSEDIKTVAKNVNIPENTTKHEAISVLSEHVSLSPLVRNMVRENGISVEEIRTIKGSGLEGRITKDDIERFISGKKNIQQSVVVNDSAVTSSETAKDAPVSENKAKTDFSVFGDIQINEMSRMRKLIAGHMLHSVQTAPHVTSFVKADITNMFTWQKNHKEEFFKKEGEKLTLMPLFVQETARALRECPEVNVSIDGEKIIYKKYYNIGMATSLPDGNLIVPVIKNADQKNLYGLARAVNDLSKRARENKLIPDDITGGTFTITNLGSFGTMSGTPIINQPESAILAVGSVRKEPAVIETPNGDAIAIRYMIILALTYDHRIIDGALAGRFLNIMVKNIENFDVHTSL